MSKKLTLIQRIIKAVWPTKRAEIKPKPGICSECGQSFIGNPRQLTCGAKACKKARRNRILSERYKPVEPPLVQAIRAADPDIKVTLNEL